MNNESSGTNTVLLVIILVVLVGFGVWWMSTRGVGQAGDQSDSKGADLNIDINGSMTPPDSDK